MKEVYFQEIIKMLSKIKNDEEKLKKVYTFLKHFLNNSP